jgi:hypothetical protein
MAIVGPGGLTDGFFGNAGPTPRDNINIPRAAETLSDRSIKIDYQG